MISLTRVPAALLKTSIIAILATFACGVPAQDQFALRSLPSTGFGIITSMQVYEDTTRLWLFAVETQSRSGSGASTPAFLHILIVDKSGMLSKHRVRHSFEIDGRFVTITRVNGEIFAVRSYYGDTDPEVLKLSEVGFRLSRRDEATEVLKAVREMTAERNEFAPADGEWAELDRFQRGALLLGRENDFSRVSRSKAGALSVDEVVSEGTGITISPNVSHTVVTAIFQETAVDETLIDLRSE